VIVVGLGILFLWKHEPEPESTLRRLAATLCSNNPAQLPGDLKGFIAKTATLQQIDPSVVLRGREEMVEHAQLLRATMPNCSVDVSFESTGSDERNAWAVGEVRYSASQAFDLHGRHRPVRIRLRRQAQSLQVTQIWIGPQQRSVPEARP